MKRAIEVLGREKEKKQALIAWKSSLAGDTAVKQAAADEALRDAHQTIMLLHSLKSPGSLPEFEKQLQAIEGEYRLAKALYDQGLYESAHASSSNIVMKGASLVRENFWFRTEHSRILIELEASLEGLIGEVESNRTLELQDPESGEKFVEDLNEYSGNGRYEQFQILLESMRERIRNEGELMSNFQLLKLQEQLEEYRGTAEALFEEATQAMKCYYQKTNVMDVIAEFMEEQGYEISWVQPAGDDLTNKLVVNFKSMYTDNSVSFTLDLGGDGSDISTLMLDMMMFYQHHEVSEADKQALRDHINEVLHHAGISGGISCTGRINRPSLQIEYNSQEAVINMEGN